MMLQEIYDDDPDKRTHTLNFLINYKMFFFENLLYNEIGLKNKIFFNNV